MIQTEEIVGVKGIASHFQVIKVDTALLNLQKTWFICPESRIAFGEAIVDDFKVIK